MSTYYFAARYSRHPEMRAYRDELESAIPGAKVVARWIDCHNEELEQSYTPEALNADPAACWRHGADDLADLHLSDVIVSFTGNGGGGKGGRHIEHGYAMAREHWTGAPRVVIVGPRENIFHCHPDTEVYPDWVTFLAAEIDLSAEGRPVISLIRHPFRWLAHKLVAAAWRYIP